MSSDESGRRVSRRALLGVVAIPTAALAGCAAGGAMVASPDTFSIERVEVIKQATRAGVRVTVKSHDMSRFDAAVRLELFAENGEIIDQHDLVVNVPGAGSSRTFTYWFDLHNVENVKQVFGADATLISEGEMR